MKNIKVLAIGGCHIAGYGLPNQKDNFVDVLISAVNSEEITFEKKTQEYVALKNFRQKTDNIHEFAPHILLIQLGNHEFTFSLKKELFSSLKLKKKKKVVRETSADTPPAAKAGMVSRPQYLKVVVKSWFKLAFDTLVSVTEKKLQVRKAELRQFIELLDQLNYDIILLSPFPVLDKFDQKTRRSASKVIEHHEFRNKKIRYINTHALVPQKRTYFQDPIHLNKEGHLRIANKLQSVFNELCGLHQSNTVIM
ncbi:SGNH/GDSL hydrolase family protein [Chitinophaga varians]|uniref:SGNH/GDSL hydrolase family protein n=1 Tax=Chitinophaga varians TaxID=2202339 RepID=UPI00166002CD|nr:SGNH/GDSL hydrolase family protein [Chitinophaga varians]MBC9909142.1 SGNH/GDSL hydrolase family protein [Chitinophaga varians]